MSFDKKKRLNLKKKIKSQSLSSRAMSFDIWYLYQDERIYVSIPFEQGDVFRPKSYVLKTATKWSQSLSSRAMSFDWILVRKHEQSVSQSLSSRAMSFDSRTWQWWLLAWTVSIPFEQGDVFRRKSLGNILLGDAVSIPFEQGDVFRRCKSRRC